MYVNEGMAYILNSSMGVSVGGAPSPKAEFYIGLSTTNRNWTEADIAATIHTVAGEHEDYTEGVRPAWNPQALATTSNLYLDDTGFEAVFTMGGLTGTGGTVTIYGAFIISVAPSDGSSDATATLIAGQNFTTPEVMSPGNTLNIGKKLLPVNCP